MPSLSTEAQSIMKQLNTFAVLLKRLAILIATVVLLIAVWDLYRQLIPNVWYRRHLAFSIIGLWVLTAYVVLPYVHRFLARIYVPVNFVGRTRTADGLLGDPVNLGINGSKQALIEAMTAAGWQQADPLSIRTGFKIALASILGRSYPNAPVSALFLFGRRQDLVFQQQVDDNPRKRHHVRFWRVPRKWYLPGGYRADWIGAATYDDALGISLFTGQITHKIDANVDKERDFLIQSLQTAQMLRSSTQVKHYFNSYQTRNGGGHEYITDGSIIIADLRAESHLQSDQAMHHANLDTIQEEVHNLATAQGISLSPGERQILIARIREELAELEQAKRSDHAADEAMDVAVQAIQLVAALGKNAGEVYRDRMDKNWDRVRPGVSKEAP